MKKNFWQVIISYFRDVVLESTSSGYNRELQVVLSSGRYQLCAGNAVYSYEDKYINFRKSFGWIDWDREGVQKVLLLGLGLGSVPQMLEEVFGQHFEYHAVEIDEEVIYLANKYILHKLQSPIQIFQTDGRHFVRITEEKYDMVIMDIFEREKVPEIFEEEDFLEDLSQCLNEKGFILYNRLNITEQDMEDTMYYFEKVFRKKFPEAQCMEVESNFILSSRKDVFSRWVS